MIAWSEESLSPAKTREIVNPYMDSTIWNRFEYRAGDIVIANWGKSGCTWMQQIVAQLLFNGSSNVSVAEISPWLEFPLPSPDDTITLLTNQTHRRFIKTHLPIGALNFSASARYVYLGRDGRDVVWSLYNHFRRLSSIWYAKMHGERGRFGELPQESPNDFRSFFLDWLEKEGYPFWPFWEHILSWWNIRHLPNVMLINYQELKTDLALSIARVAQHLSLECDDELLSNICAHSSLAYMRDQAASIVRGDESVFEGGVRSFFNKGGTGGWQGLLQQSDLDRYAEQQSESLPRDCIEWLEGRCVPD